MAEEIDRIVHPIVYVSRVLHMLSWATIAGGCIVDVSGAGSLHAQNHLPLTIAGVVALITGLLNSHFNKPSKMGSTAKYYRILMYAVKIPLFLVFTPLGAKLVPSGDKAALAQVRAGVAVLMVMLSTWTKFFREHQTRKAQQEANAKNQ